ncbi:integration host factor, actinobacterial type [Streptomyces sp. NPDC005385]|uniref:integration host factor, actinobacterial type n=1 Tax=Streptomyces sp. NPDC005385 TaxID=3157039 RepID=UPI0033AA6CE8
MKGFVMALPTLSPKQRQEALARAAVVRKERAEIKAALKSGETSLEEVLSSTAQAVRRMPVASLLASMPGIGKIRAQRLMNELDIADNRRINGLGPQQRDRLIESFPA